MLVEALLSAIANVLLLAGIPFLVYWAWHRWRHGRRLPEVARRAGLQVGETRYIAYCAILAAVSVAALVLFPPPLEPMTREASAQHAFVGLGLTGTSVTMALLYGIVKTGFAEEFLFRGLIAGSLGRRLPLLWANLLQALVFLLPHLLVLVAMPELWPILPIVFVASLVLGWARIRSGLILGPWLAHAVGNVATCLSVAVRTAG
ncbi:MAG TPA: CPBP family intramembrane glutamic endopeptidase [Gemmatimonadota bacterium]|nr:CPBP family intramembrane glutamic endopeptidase [Gemmatimonadota bacterium]